MFVRLLPVTRDLSVSDLVQCRYLRSSRVAISKQERRKLQLEEQTRQKLQLEEQKLVNDKEQQLQAWREEDESKLTAWTAWRRKKEDNEAKCHVPLPVSLTGFGDGAKPRYWSYKIKRALMDWLVVKEKEDLPFYIKVPSALEHVLSSETALDAKYKPIQDKLITEKKEKSKEISLKKEKEDHIQFPFELLDELRKSDDSDHKITEPRLRSGEIDKEYDDFLQHHNFVQHLALNSKKVRPVDYKEEIAAFGGEVWRRKYGSPDTSVPPSDIACGGCGAYLHCNDQAIPGYIPSELFVDRHPGELRHSLCQRCEYLSTYNVCLDATVSAESYPKILAEIKESDALVILMVDLTDFPASIWPNVLHLFGTNRKIYVVGNKVDLLPKDEVGYLERVLDGLKRALSYAGTRENVNVRHTCLISAKTGYGVESLVTKLAREDNGGRDIFLVGCTNVGKSTLFNSLLQSDLCKVRSNDLIQRATTSLWPGTTINLLKFPIAKLRGWEIKKRLDRLRCYDNLKMREEEMRKTIFRQTKNPRLAILSDRVGMTFQQDVPFTVESGHPMAKMHQVPKPFVADDRYYQHSKFFHDTPGSIYKEQLLTLLTTEELLKTIPRERIIPRTFSLWPDQTLFLAGLGRIDVLHARQNILLTVFASHYLPIHVISTEQARQFYKTFLGSSMLQVPLGGPERLKKWPIMVPKEIDLTGIGWTESCADIVLSSAGWVSATFHRNSQAVFKVFTPEGRGIYVRKPALLPYAVKLKGKKIEGTPCFEAYRSTIDDIGDDSFERIYKKYNNKHSLPDYRETSEDVKSRRFIA